MVKIIGKGGANYVLAFGNDNDDLYRICVRGRSLRENNRSTVDNYHYALEVVKPQLGEFVCRMELVDLPVCDSLRQVLKSKIEVWDATTVTCLKMPNLVPAGSLSHTVDHFTKIHIGERAIVWEFKPKWLSGNDKYCRNCTLNLLRGQTSISYCHAQLLNPGQAGPILKSLFAGLNVPPAFIEDMEAYIAQPCSVLQRLRVAQEQVDASLGPLDQPDTAASPERCLSMTLKDVSCFVSWHKDASPVAVVVDLDMKPAAKSAHWTALQEQLDRFQPQVRH
ncbi:AAL037Cp [Eremothecium gossypii ATCC 10895]|uniref:Inositol-pentakisphosphate 2-kinase n=1 Tax=Eremothecium gossypii (strain ATCC 10895 / CBS 109.51 / FGSC 9923 / NRRL Y-1056) TaxID=284811 RepID=IPK1_EREGS|nr:AAL037Cp [Eremothecium gossypii ATCC 10895]Q75EW5.1 RecName: Full=Inositol-pentakisphosphate 2-kinase; AltName: Full=Inositol-1,3,4,5,6-pentakisphosphate 2-kinase; AltName: Full=Ins(1,3,4,5,6)P5 2-kinase; Short=InsP5 2-kinase [Eremothecium gossypii ATCC 10895]AAS50329.1 AAL037Cp [Eremothecium gossypii ATCC 10895]AEY94615.1 FAAL037Cp [Eremothecium gossypii FDAG1]